MCNRLQGVELQEFQEGIFFRGSSCCFKVLGDDGCSWVVKVPKYRNGEPFVHQRVFNEYFAGILACSLNINHPDTKIIDVTNFISDLNERLLSKEFINEEARFEFSSDCGIGVAIRYIENSRKLIDKDLPVADDIDGIRPYYLFKEFVKKVYLADLKGPEDFLYSEADGGPVFIDFDFAFGGEVNWGLPSVSERNKYKRVLFRSLESSGIGLYQPSNIRMNFENCFRDLLSSDEFMRQIDLPSCWGVPDNYLRDLSCRLLEV